MLDDPGSELWRVVAERPECRTGVRDGFLDYLVMVARPKTGPGPELNRIDVTQHVFRQRFIEPVDDVGDIGVSGRRRHGKQQAANYPGPDQSRVAFAGTEKILPVITDGMLPC